MKDKEQAHRSPNAKLHALPYGSVEIADEFWTSRRELMRTKVLLSQWDQLERTGCVDNFRVLAGEKEGEHRGWGFADSDLYKWLEAAAWVLGRHPDDRPLADHADEAIRLIRKGQMDDGYINTYYQLAAPGRRYSNLLIKHELYCLGHLIEAGCTHRIATGREDLFEAAVQCGDHICATFGPDRNEGVPGHEEVELALMHLYRATGDRRYLDTTRFFLFQRGRPGQFRRMFLQGLRDLWMSSPLGKPPAAPFMPGSVETTESSVGRKDRKLGDIAKGLRRIGRRKYFQMHEPLCDHTVAEGHSVRAMYLYTAAADLLLEADEAGLREVLEQVWDNTIDKRTYITGGMGSFPYSEGFGEDHELPNRSYTETCAAIGSLFFAQRMLAASGHPRFADQAERALYNAILGCLSGDGERYFYSNPLQSEGHTERVEWYDVPCCPPNLGRLFWSLEQYIYGVSENTLWVHQYIGNRARVSLDACDVTVTMKSGFPFDGGVTMEIGVEKTESFRLRLRIPSWSYRTHISINDEEVAMDAQAGSHADINREWRPGDQVSLTFAMEPAMKDDHPRVKSNRGRVVIQRGPVVYCVQGADNPGLDVHAMSVDRGDMLDVEVEDGFATLTGRTTSGKPFRAIPYYNWGNKGRTPMAVWLLAR